MGMVNSTDTLKLLDNELLNRLTGIHSISENDPFWNQLFSFSQIAGSLLSDESCAEEITKSYCKSFITNNRVSGNFISLIKVFIFRSSELLSSVECDNNLFMQQTSNALFIIRHVCKFLVENVTENQVIDFFEVLSPNKLEGSLTGDSALEFTSVNYIKEFITTLMDIVVNVPLLHSTQEIHLETRKCLLVFLSVQMFSQSSSDSHLIYEVLMHDVSKSRINSFMHELIQNFVEHKFHSTTVGEVKGGSSILDLASVVTSGLWSILKFSKNDDSSANSEMQYTVAKSETSVSYQSCLLILILINYQPKNVSSKNPYLCAFSDFQFYSGQSNTTTSITKRPPPFHVNLAKLYTTTCTTMHEGCECGTLLLYSLVQTNSNVRAYFLSKADIDSLILPILKVLHLASSKNSYNVYMLLIVLLILTEDDDFSKNVHRIKLESVPWYKDRLLVDVTLGDVIILVVLGLIQFNLCHMEDRYLYTNSLAMLANMSAHFHSISKITAQKFFCLLALVAKRYNCFTAKSANVSACKMIQNTTSEVKACATNRQVLEEVIRMLLEITNSCLTRGSILHNSNLVYVLLQQHQIFNDLDQHNVFNDLLKNIKTVVNYFVERLNELQNPAVTSQQVEDVISKTIKQLPDYSLEKSPELKFHYVEAEAPEEFFVPYIWSLAFNKSGIPWNPVCIQLFALEQFQ